MLRAGFASEVISPPKGISLAGYFNRRPNTGVLDDLHVRAALFADDAGNKAGVVNFDLISTHSVIVKRVGQLLREKGVVFADNLLFCATHTHTGPDLDDIHSHAEPGLDEKKLKAAVDAYMTMLVERTAACVMAAQKCMEEVTLAAATRKGNPYAFIRRYWMKDGTVRTNPGKLNPDIVKPEGPLDEEIGVVAIRQAVTGKLLGVFANMCNHTDTVGGMLVSADWPGALERALRRKLGSQLNVIPLVGASGDVNHFDVSSSANQTCPEEAERIGKGYAEIVADLVEKAKPFPAKTVECLSTMLTLSKRVISQEEIDAAKKLVAKRVESKGRDLTSEDLAKGDEAIRRVFAQELLAFAEKEAGRSVSIPLRGVRLGDMAICSLPGEPFCAIGAAIKKRSPFPYTFLASNAMTYCGYIPMKECFVRGGYEVIPVMNGGLETDSAEKLIEAVSAMLKGC